MVRGKRARERLDSFSGARAPAAASSASVTDTELEGLLEGRPHPIGWTQMQAHERLDFIATRMIMEARAGTKAHRELNDILSPDQYRRRLAREVFDETLVGEVVDGTTKLARRKGDGVRVDLAHKARSGSTIRRREMGLTALQELL